jgi:hypothetical protein
MKESQGYYSSTARKNLIQGTCREIFVCEQIPNVVVDELDRF